MIGNREVGVVIAGGGPASLSLLVNAQRRLKMAPLLQSGLLILERGDNLGAGLLEKYVIDSNTKAIGFLRSLFREPEALLDVTIPYHPR